MEYKTEKIKKRYNRISRVYDLLERPIETMFSKWRSEIMKEVSGNVLEVGVGTGKNLQYYPVDAKVTAIDFSPHMVEAAREKVKKLTKDITVLEMDAQQMNFKDDTFDTVVTSCVFCSVPDPVKGLKEIRRVCKNGGKVVMLEHVRSNKPLLGSVMDILNPIPLHIYGANINRDTIKNLRKAGFQNINVTDIWLDIVKLITITNIKKSDSEQK